MDPIEAYSLEEIDDGLLIREAVLKGKLHEFTRQFWGVVEPSHPFEDNWHFGAVSEFYEAIFTGQIRKGVINVPPGTGKTVTINVMAPAYTWARDPSFKTLSTGFDQSVLNAASQKCLDILRSPLYRSAFPEVELTKDEPPVSEVWTTQRGLRFCTSIAGRGTGWHGDLVTVDDSVKANEGIREKSVANKRTIEWYQSTAQSRRSNPKAFRFLCVMQRVAEGDLPGYLLEQGFEHLCLPMRYAPAATWIRGDWSSKLDPRKNEGELLFPERFPEDIVKELEVGLGTDANISAQLQQNPTPRSGGVIQDKWLRTWINLPESVLFVQVWDLNFKGTQSSHSMVVGNLYAIGTTTATLGNVYLVDEVRGLWSYPESRAEYIAAQERPLWDQTVVALFEAKANGPALSADLEDMAKRGDLKNSRGHLTSVILPTLREPKQGDKFLRVVEQTGKIRSGRLHVPSEGAFPNLNGKDGWISEICGFPYAIKNDRVDNLSMMLDFASSNELGLLSWADHGGSE